MSNFHFFVFHFQALRSIYDSNVGNNGNYISRAQLHSANASSTGSLAVRFALYDQKNFYHPSEQYGYYSSKAPQLNPQQSIMNSSVRRLIGDGSVRGSNPSWATLPRRFQHGSASSSPALNTSLNISQESKMSLPLQHPTVDRIMSQASPSHFRETFASSVRSSPSKTQPLFPEETSVLRSTTSPAPTTSNQARLSIEGKAANDKSSVCCDVKEVSL